MLTRSSPPAEFGAEAADALAHILEAEGERHQRQHEAFVWLRLGGKPATSELTPSAIRQKRAGSSCVASVYFCRPTQKEYLPSPSDLFR